MAIYLATVEWQRDGQDFLGNRYSRRHSIAFDGGARWVGSSSPHVVPEPMSDATAVDPEEAFIASLSSCHMLWFLSLAAQQGFCVERYRDAAEGRMGRNAEDRIAMTLVTLRPEVHFSGARQPTQAEHDASASCSP